MMRQRNRPSGPAYSNRNDAALSSIVEAECGAFGRAAFRALLGACTRPHIGQRAVPVSELIDRSRLPHAMHVWGAFFCDFMFPVGARDDEAGTE